MELKEELTWEKLSAETFRNDNFSEPAYKIIELIFADNLSKVNINSVLWEHNIASVDLFKNESLEIICTIIRVLLNDHRITENEVNKIKSLNKYFEIEEGEFLHYKQFAISDILNSQFALMYSDKNIDYEESIQKVRLQEIFGLGYDQFLEFANVYDETSLNLGANVLDLDTVYFLN